MSSLEESIIFSSLIGNKFDLLDLRLEAYLSSFIWSFRILRFFKVLSSISIPDPALLMMSQSTMWKEMQSMSMSEVAVWLSLRRDLVIKK